MPELKRVCAINDISGFGRCSLTVAIPVISSFGLQVCPFPTAVLSAHTGFKHYSFCDLTPTMQEYEEKWDALGIEFDCIYSGFLGSEAQIDIVERLIKKQKKALILIDPVMGDDGVIYKTYTKKLCLAMQRLCRCADIITPNLTEACILLNEPYPQKELSDGEISSLLERLKGLGAKNGVITGIPKNNKLISAAYTQTQAAAFETVHIDIDINGSGDLFASLLCAYTLKGLPFLEAVEKAGRFVTRAIEYTRKYTDNSEYGIMFEPLLRE